MSEPIPSLTARLIRNIDDALSEHWSRDPLYESNTAPLSSGTAAKKLSARVERVPPGKRSCPYHLHHAQEEMFVVLSGTGTLRVAGEMLSIKTGDVIMIPAGPEYPHQIINTSDLPLKYLAVGTTEAPEICEYPDSGKFLAEAALDKAHPFEVISKVGNTLEYWEGEP